MSTPMIITAPRVQRIDTMAVTKSESTCKRRLYGCNIIVLHGASVYHYRSCELNVCCVCILPLQTQLVGLLVLSAVL